MSAAPDKDNVLVYSSEKGRICPSCEKPVNECLCKQKEYIPTGDGIVRVRREVKGRGGKTVSSISGIPLPDTKLREISTTLKKRCGTGGTVKSGTIEIQGDHIDTLVDELSKMGFKVKRSGG